MRPAAIRRTRPRPSISTTRCGPGRRRCVPYNPLVHPRSWRSFMEYSNGIIGDMCIHMFDAVRWMLGLGWPTRIASSGGILVEKESKANIADTQTATFDYGDLNVVWQHRTLGRHARPEISLGSDVLRREGHAEGQRDRATISSPRAARASRSIATWPTSWSNIPKTRRKRTWSGTSPRRSAGTCKTSWRRSPPAAGRWPTSKRATSRPPVASWRIMAMRLGRTLDLGRREAAGGGRRRGQSPLAAAVPPAVGPPVGFVSF